MGSCVVRVLCYMHVHAGVWVHKPQISARGTTTDSIPARRDPLRCTIFIIHKLYFI